MKTPTSWVQGFNAQAAVNEHGVVIAAAVTQDHNDVHQCEPMMDAVGMPIFSTTAAARNTAGVQLPQAPMPTITASAWCARSFSGSEATISRSRAPWKLPNSV